MAVEKTGQVTAEELFALIKKAGSKGITYSNISLKLLGTDNPPRNVADHSFKPALMTLSKSGAIEKKGSNWYVPVVGESDTSREHLELAPKASAKETHSNADDLPAVIRGLLFVPKGKGKVGSLFTQALHDLTFETRPIKFTNAVAWISQNQDGPWMPLGEVRGSRVMLDSKAPDFKAIPYSPKYIKVFVADEEGGDTGCYYQAELSEDWLAWVGSIE